jgi:asparagine synthase (glutamine-hydrolysing)
MCGIYGTWNADGNFYAGKHRGPDHSACLCIYPVTLGFHRLAINDLTDHGNQPFVLDGVYLVCNGEIYNHAALVQEHRLPVASRSDCEVILHLYLRFGMDLLTMIDVSEFAFLLYDSRVNLLYAARDAMGVRPLYRAVVGQRVVYASELKMCYIPEANFAHVMPGTYETYDGVRATTTQYYVLPRVRDVALNVTDMVYTTLYNAVLKRVRNTDRPVACLLSGGLDSSIVTALVVECRRHLGYSDPVETFCIGLEGGEDMHHAALVAEHLGTRHTSIVCGEDDFFNAIPAVVHAIESYDTTSVRASVGQWLVAKYVAENSTAKVLFNGDGADELAGGYLYMKHAPDRFAFDAECRRLLRDIHCFDALRSDRCISAHGLEARTPFLDADVVQMYLAIPVNYRYTNVEKLLLRETFQHLLPASVVWRQKEAFSDGVSSMKESWFQIIQRKVPLVESTATWNHPATPEQKYYRYLFDLNYANAAGIIPYFWMPRFVAATDCSARTLSTYHQEK